jgi:hypothetical protein
VFHPRLLTNFNLYKTLPLDKKQHRAEHAPIPKPGQTDPNLEPNQRVQVPGDPFSIQTAAVNQEAFHLCGQTALRSHCIRPALV